MSTAPTNLVLRHAGPAETLQLRDDVLPVYAASHDDLMHDPWFAPEQFWQRLVDIYAKTRDFDLVTAWLDESVVGYAFGSPRDTEDLWPAIHPRMPHLDASGPVYIFREFAVHPAHQRKGYGRAIHDELLCHRSERAAHLLVRPDNIPATTAYRRWGWLKVGTQKPFADSPTFDALALDLSARSDNAGVAPSPRCWS